MRFNPYMEICALFFLLMLAMHFFSRRRYPCPQNKYFAAFIAVGSADVLMDIASAYTIEFAAKLPLWLNIFISSAYYISQVTLPAMLFLYVLSLSGEMARRRALSKTRRLSVLLPLAVTIVLVLLNPWTRMFFYFDDAREYCYGPLKPLLYAESVFYLFRSLIAAVRGRTSLRRAQYVTLLTFLAVIGAAMILQVLLPEYLVTGVALTAAILMMYLTLQNPDGRIDPLTGAFDRNGYFIYVDGLDARKKTYQATLIDLESFVRLTRVIGSASADRLLAEAGAFLRRAAGNGACFRMRDARMLIINTDEDDMLRLISRAEKRFGEPFKLGGLSFPLTADICYTPDASLCAGPEALSELMDYALARKQGAAQKESMSFGAELIAKARREKNVESLLRRALDNKRVECFLQPIVEFQSGRIVRAEALARLRDDKGTLVMPGEFVPIAERTGLVASLGQAMLENACAFLRDSGADIGRVCVNLSAIECMDDSLSQRILSTVRKYQVSPSRLCFEITETASSLSPGLPGQMRALQSAGFHFSLDDFGTGYSNFDSVMRLPFETVKIDKSLLNGSDSSARGGLVFTRAVDMVRALGFDVIVEGVETAQQAASVRRAGAAFAQGYFFYKPMPAEDLKRIVGKREVG